VSLKLFQWIRQITLYFSPFIIHEAYLGNLTYLYYKQPQKQKKAATKGDTFEATSFFLINYGSGTIPAGFIAFRLSGVQGPL
jgi:hypothetical protein